MRYGWLLLLTACTEMEPPRAVQTCREMLKVARTSTDTILVLTAKPRGRTWTCADWFESYPAPQGKP